MRRICCYQGKVLHGYNMISLYHSIHVLSLHFTLKYLSLFCFVNKKCSQSVNNTELSNIIFPVLYLLYPIEAHKRKFREEKMKIWKKKVSKNNTGCFIVAVPFPLSRPAAKIHILFWKYSGVPMKHQQLI